jgi:glycosyltransferase involved in cell wall biosynthesis
MAPTAAVVVATYDRSENLPRLVASLEAQQGVADFETVVVDDGSTDDTWAVINALAARASISIRPIRQPRNAGPAAARNVGWRATTAPVVAFTDDDCTPSEGWLFELLRGSRSHDIVQGRTVPDPAQRQRLGPFSRTLAVSHEDGFYQTCNVAYRREVLEAVDGFHEQFRFPAGEDTDLAWRAKEAGASATFAAEAVVHHDVRTSDLVVAIRDSWRWQSIALVIRRHPELRGFLASRYVWRASHGRALSALAGLGLVVNRPRSASRWIAAAALAAPYVQYRTAVRPLPGTGPRRRWLLLPGALVVDTAEIVACLVGSAKYRTFVL